MITTLLGIGGFPGSHALNLGMPGMHGMYWNNIAISESDLLLGIGMRFDDRVTGACGTSRRAPRSSTSTSTPPRSARTCSPRPPFTAT